MLLAMSFVSDNLLCQGPKITFLFFLWTQFYDLVFSFAVLVYDVTCIFYKKKKNSVFLGIAKCVVGNLVNVM